MFMFTPTSLLLAFRYADLLYAYGMAAAAAAMPLIAAILHFGLMAVTRVHATAAATLIRLWLLSAPAPMLSGVML